MAAIGEAAVPRQAALALDLPPGRHRLRPHVLDRPAAAGRSWPSASSSAGPRRRWCRPATDDDPQIPVPLPRRAGGGDGLHPRPPGGSRRGLHFLAGRLHAVLPLLPHRHADAGAQPGRGRDRRPVHGGARRLRRMAEPEGRNAAAAVHHRADGHGRAAVQLRQRRQGDDASSMDNEGIGAVAPADHAVHLRRRADDGSRGRRAGREPRGVAARGDATSCATSSCR